MNSRYTNRLGSTPCLVRRASLRRTDCDLASVWWSTDHGPYYHIRPVSAKLTERYDVGLELRKLLSAAKELLSCVYKKSAGARHGGAYISWLFVMQLW